MTKLDKPLPDEKGRIRYSDAIAYLEKKYRFDSYDYNKSQGHYDSWCKAHGKPRNPKTIEESQRLYSEYCAAPDGDRACPPTENFWHWLLDLVKLPVPNSKLPSFFKLNIPKVLATYDSAVAPVRQAQAAAVSTLVESMVHLIPEELRERALRQYAPKPATLQPFVRTILGYFQAEFGDVVHFDLRRN